MSAKRVLITGVSGLVGSAIYLHLRQWPEAYELHGLGRRREVSERVTDHRAIDLPDDRYSVCDLSDWSGVRHAVEGMDVVVHMAADPAGRSWESLLSANLVGAYNVFEASQQAGVKRIVAASTIQVVSGYRSEREPYISLTRRVLAEMPPGGAWVTADMPAEPRNLYASTKVFCESLCRTYAHSRGISCLGIRIGWVVGEDRPPHANGSDVWCSQRDIARLVRCCVDAPEEVRFGIFFGVSESRRRWVDLEHAREVVGYVPMDRSEDHL